MRSVAPLSDAERAAMLDCARDLVGVRFKHMGRSRNGVDCVGLVALALASVGRTVSEKVYGRNPVNDGLRQTCRDHFGDPVDDMRAGDVALMAVWDDPSNREPNHVGLLFDHPNGGLAIVHALAQNRRVIAHRLDDFAADQIVEAYRP